MKDEILTCCNHWDYRHEYFEDGSHMCLSGFCRCGRKPLKPKPPKEYKQSALGQAYRGFKKKAVELAVEEL